MNVNDWQGIAIHAKPWSFNLSISIRLVRNPDTRVMSCRTASLSKSKPCLSSPSLDTQYSSFIDMLIYTKGLWNRSSPYHFPELAARPFEKAYQWESQDALKHQSDLVAKVEWGVEWIGFSAVAAFQLYLWKYNKANDFLSSQMTGLWHIRPWSQRQATHLDLVLWTFTYFKRSTRKRT